MKKVVSIISLIVVFFVLYILQINFFSWFTIARISPNLFIVLTLFIGLYIGKEYAAILGILFGLIIDLNLSMKIGITSIALGIIGFISGYIDQKFSKDSRLSFILIVMGSTIVYEIIFYILRIIILNSTIDMLPLLKIIGIETIYNVIIIIIIYPLLKNLGEKLEKIFKGRRFNNYY